LLSIACSVPLLYNWRYHHHHHCRQGHHQSPFTNYQPPTTHSISGCNDAGNATFSLDKIILKGDGGSGWTGGSLHGVYAVTNPAPWPNKTDSYLIFFTGMSVVNPSGTRRIGVAYAPSVSGPWSVWPNPVLEPNRNASAVDTSSVSNAAPAFNRDGSGRVLLAYVVAFHKPTLNSCLGACLGQLS
jgi:hypothetical protein